MEKKYSVAVYPSQDVINAVKTMKDYLKSKIDWYNSCNSVVHITICEFTIDDSQIEKFKQKLLKICDTLTPSQVYLDHFGSYDSGAFYIAPTEDSKNNLKPIVKKTQEALKLLKPLKWTKSDDPHMSIGRKLTPENIKIASQLFTTIALDFSCKEIVLRELDPIKKQFFVIDTFSFGSNPEPEFVQGSLF